jgi:hypothetical protein
MHEHEQCEIFTGHQFFASIAENTEIKNLGCATSDLLISHQAEHKMI